MIFFYVVIFVLYFYSVKYLVSKGKKQKVPPVQSFPGPKPYPIIGNIVNFFTTDLQEMHRREVEAFKQYGDTFQVRTITNRIVATMDPKLCEKILGSSTHYIEKADDYKILKSLIGNGLVRSEGYHWRSHRKIIQPAFTAMNTIKGFIGIFDQKAQTFVEVLKEHCDGKLVDIDGPVERLTGDIIMETSMGIESNAQITNDCEYIRANNILKYLCTKKIVSYWKRFDVLFSTFAYREKRVFDKNMTVARKFAIEVIEKRRKYLLEQNSASNNNNYNGDGRQNKGMCFVDILLQSTIDGQPLTNEDMVDQMHTFMIGGQDTSALTISAALYFLSRHKSIQEKVYAEIGDVFGSDRNSPITYQQLLELKYMEMVLKETLRLHPAIGIIGRNIDHDLELDDGRIIPAGFDIRLYLGLMMRSPKYFKDPDTFDPERFASNAMNQFTYAPFSTGKRDCVGKKFAMFSIKTILTRVLQHYELIEMGDEPIIQNEVIARSINGFQMAMKARKCAKC